VTLDLFNGQLRRNQLVIKLERNPGIEMKIMSKSPGITTNVEDIKINFDYKNEYIVSSLSNI
jgi:glucose-6-phosphate 1-dehydrogenase